MNCRRCPAPMYSTPTPPSGSPSNARRHAGRGLCNSCRHHAEADGTLCDYPRLRHARTREEFLEDYDWLRRDGLTWAQAADRMDMDVSAFERAMYRARKSGDERAFRRNWRGDNHANRAAPIPREDLLAAYASLRDQPLTLKECARRIGVPYQQFRRGLDRARMAGDPRAERVKEVA